MHGLCKHLRRLGGNMNGIDLIRAERTRQRSRKTGGEFYSLAHDDEHDAGEISRVAAVYAMPPAFRMRNQDLVAALTPLGWYLKLSTGDRKRELAKAGALIAAELDRLIRRESTIAAAPSPPTEETRHAD